MAEHFRAWGVKNPEDWARSQVLHGIDQYARLVFLRGAWQCVVKAGDTSWIDAYIGAAERDPDGPGAGAGHALKRLCSAGASREDLAELVRVMQFEVLFGFAYLLSDAEAPAYPQGAPHIDWRLFRLDEDGKPVSGIDSLHESVLETDPTGNEMRPTPSRSG